MDLDLWQHFKDGVSNNTISKTATVTRTVDLGEKGDRQTTITNHVDKPQILARSTTHELETTNHNQDHKREA